MMNSALNFSDMLFFLLIFHPVAPGAWASSAPCLLPAHVAPVPLDGLTECPKAEHLQMPEYSLLCPMH